MKPVPRIVLSAALIGTLVLQGCAYRDTAPDLYTADSAQREQYVRMATVESVRAVQTSANNEQSTGLGAIGGAALGAVAGGALGGGRGSILTTIVGGLVGAVVGDAVEHRAALANGMELTVQLDNGELRAITQEAGGEAFRAGDRVRLLSSNGNTRVTH